MTPRDVLTVAADWFEEPHHGLCKGRLRRMRRNGEVVQCCAIGAIGLFVRLGDRMACASVLPQLEGVVGQAVDNWNDHPETTKADVIAALRAAARRA